MKLVQVLEGTMLDMNLFRTVVRKNGFYDGVCKHDNF